MSENFAGNPTCCWCFSLKTGVWLIGSLVILNVASSFYSAAVYSLWGFYAVQLVLEAIFCVIFLITMISSIHDTYKTRNTVFIYYLIGILIIPLIIDVLGLIGIQWDIITQICKEVKENESD